MTTAPLLLTTKLFMPMPHPNLVVRPRLRQLFDHANQSAVILVAAPAGFGKTTVVVDWLHQSAVTQPAVGRTCCWLALDEYDNDPIRFLNYLIAALQQGESTVGAAIQLALQAPQPPPIEALLTMLINDLSRLATPTVLVLDDYHTITTPAIHNAVSFLIEHRPATLKLIITSRVDPPFPLSRWRVRRLLTEIRATDLRFTTAETAAFLQETAALTLAPDDVSQLEQRTEGWIAALQLAALSMQVQRDHRAFIHQLSGNHTYIVDYLTEEVLQRQPTAVQEFLYQTAILDRFCGPLCDAVTGCADGQALLEQLHRTNLFLIPLDDERQWYRYHHLFAEMLRNRLNHQPATDRRQLHDRASHWFAGAALLDEAIRHAVLATNYDLAADLVERHALLNNAI